MNTLELKTILKNDPWAWNTKVCAIDELPSNVITYPAAFIVNTDERDEPGEHWLAIYLTCTQKAEFFDSYGHAPCYFNNKLCHFLSSYDIQYNTRPFQGPLSAVCGHYCVLFILHRARGVSFSNILNILDSVDSDSFAQDVLNKRHL